MRVCLGALSRSPHILLSVGLKIVLSLLVAMSLGCASLKPKLEQPSVKVAGLQLLPMQGFNQPVKIDLIIGNPNSRDLSLRGIAYTVGIENFEVLSGVENQLPTLHAYQETPVSVVVSANVLQMVQLVEHVMRRGVATDVNYNFTAKLDFSAFLPAYTVREKGAVSLASLTQQ